MAEVTSHPHHRKVDLQSPLDLRYLRQNLERSAQQKLDLHFPLLPPPQPSTSASTTTTAAAPTEEDPMRAAVSTLVSDFISTTFRSAAHSISINGLDADLATTGGQNKEDDDEAAAAVEYEPYDPRLTSQLSALYADLEALTTQVAKLRRDAPGKAAQAWGEKLQEMMLAEDEEQVAQRRRVGVDTEGGEDTTMMMKIQVPREGWQRDVEDMYERGIRGLADLVGKESGGQGVGEQVGGGGGGGGGKKSLTGTVGLVERAGGVVRELE